MYVVTITADTGELPDTEAGIAAGCLNSPGHKGKANCDISALVTDLLGQGWRITAQARNWAYVTLGRGNRAVTLRMEEVKS